MQEVNWRKSAERMVVVGALVFVLFLVLRKNFSSPRFMIATPRSFDEQMWAVPRQDLLMLEFSIASVRDLAALDPTLGPILKEYDFMYRIFVERKSAEEAGNREMVEKCDRLFAFYDKRMEVLLFSEELEYSKRRLKELHEEIIFFEALSAELDAEVEAMEVLQQEIFGEDEIEGEEMRVLGENIPGEQV